MKVTSYLTAFGNCGRGEISHSDPLLEHNVGAGQIAAGFFFRGQTVGQKGCTEMEHGLQRDLHMWGSLV
jgi:hypothetical protein